MEAQTQRQRTQIVMRWEKSYFAYPESFLQPIVDIFIMHGTRLQSLAVAFPLNQILASLKSFLQPCLQELSFACLCILCLLSSAQRAQEHATGSCSPGGALPSHPHAIRACGMECCSDRQIWMCRRHGERKSGTRSTRP